MSIKTTPHNLFLPYYAAQVYEILTSTHTVLQPSEIPRNRNTLQSQINAKANLEILLLHKNRVLCHEGHSEQTHSRGTLLALWDCSPESCHSSPCCYHGSFPWHNPTAKTQKRHNHGNWPQNLNQRLFGLH